MSTVNFNEIAEYCINRYKEHNNYKGTLYVAISSDDKVHCSNTTHILSYASKLILIHKRRDKEGFYGHDEYDLEFIDQDGSVTDGYIGNGLRLYTSSSMSLDYEINSDRSTNVKSWSDPFENKMQEIWNLCCKFRNIKSEEEAQLLIDAIENEDTHRKLKEEIDSAYKSLDELNQKYRDLLDRINKLIG